jgi:hypothetical protein
MLSLLRVGHSFLQTSRQNSKKPKYLLTREREAEEEKANERWESGVIRWGLCTVFLIVLLALIQVAHYFSPIESTLESLARSHLSQSIPKDSLNNEGEHRQLSGGGSLFGIVSQLDPIIGTLSFIVIVGAVLFVELLFHELNHMAHDTPFQHLIPAVEKELMIAGCTAFTFKILVNATNHTIPANWYAALEYAGKSYDFLFSSFPGLYYHRLMFNRLGGSYFLVRLLWIRFDSDCHVSAPV